jgi:hypothetical protein
MMALMMSVNVCMMMSVIVSASFLFPAFWANGTKQPLNVNALRVIGHAPGVKAL